MFCFFADFSTLITAPAFAFDKLSAPGLPTDLYKRTN